VKIAERGAFGGFAKRMRASAPAAMDARLVAHLVNRYGTRAPELIALAAADPALARRLLAELPYCYGEVTHAAAAEMAATLDDALRRRVPIAFRARDGGIGVSDHVAALMRGALGWTADEMAKAIADYRAGIERERERRLDGRGSGEHDVVRRRA
jgi:glycerol-3-phosphate dehydrogenase